MTTGQLLRVAGMLMVTIVIVLGIFFWFAREARCDDGCKVALCYADGECGPRCSCLARDTPEGGLCIPVLR